MHLLVKTTDIFRGICQKEIPKEINSTYKEMKSRRNIPLAPDHIIHHLVASICPFHSHFISSSLMLMLLAVLGCASGYNIIHAGCWLNEKK